MVYNTNEFRKKDFADLKSSMFKVEFITERGDLRRKKHNFGILLRVTELHIRKHNSHYSLHQLFSTRGNSAPRGHLVMCGDAFGHHNLGWGVLGSNG